MKNEQKMGKTEQNPKKKFSGKNEQKSVKTEQKIGKNEQKRIIKFFNFKISILFLNKSKYLINLISNIRIKSIKNWSKNLS
jgi:hypothetical protein